MRREGPVDQLVFQASSKVARERPCERDQRTGSQRKQQTHRAAMLSKVGARSPFGRDFVGLVIVLVRPRPSWPSLPSVPAACAASGSRSRRRAALDEAVVVALASMSPALNEVDRFLCWQLIPTISGSFFFASLNASSAPKAIARWLQEHRRPRGRVNFKCLSIEAAAGIPSRSSRADLHIRELLQRS